MFTTPTLSRCFFAQFFSLIFILSLVVLLVCSSLFVSGAFCFFPAPFGDFRTSVLNRAFFAFLSFYLSTRMVCTCPGIQCRVTELRATFEGRCCRRPIPPPGVVLGRLSRQVVKKNGKDPRISLHFLGLSAVSRRE